MLLTRASLAEQQHIPWGHTPTQRHTLCVLWQERQWMLDRSIACGAAADTVGRPVVGRPKAGIRPCTGIDETDDDRRGAFENAQKTIGGAMREKEQCVEGNKKGKSKRRTSLANLPPNNQLIHLL